MTKITTTRFGDIDIGENETIHMPHGMLGFPESKQFTILHHKQDSPFCWFQSTEDPSLAFVITSPTLFIPDYDIEVGHILKDMSWNDDLTEKDLELYVVVNIPRGSPEKMSANLIGPILINIEAHQAVQMVISNSPYSHKYPLVQQD